MRSVFVAAGTLLLCLVPFASMVFGQGGTGTITGSVTDPTGLPVAGANVQAKNVETGVVYAGASTNAGNYAIANLPVGTYEITVQVSGFKTYTHTSLAVAAAQVLRVDIPLEVGATSESITVEAQASLLQTETGDLVNNVTVQQMDELPLLGIGTVNAGTSGYRNPYNTMLTLPGVASYNASGLVTVNGLGGAPPGGFLPALTETMRIEGQDATSRLFNTYVYTQMAQPNTDAVQEIAYQTSNYAAEYGTAGSVVINMTMKSGTNQYHGTGFDYFVNEDLNAADPFTIDTNGNKYRPLNRRNDFGGTIGGPVIIPKLYNGKNKTFFFFAYEQFLEGTGYAFVDTVPTAAFRAGDFSAISPNGSCSLCGPLGIPTTSFGNDPAGQPVYANEIYDPLTRGVTAQGLGYASPFPNNMIPASRFSASSLAFMALFPQPSNGNVLNNYNGNIRGGRYSAIPSIKVDQIITQKDKLSFYWDRNNTESQISAPLGNADGLPPEIGGYRGTFIPNWTTRLNYDRTITPTLLLHLGVGYFHTSFSDRAPFLTFNPSNFDLTGFVQDRQFPSVTGMCTPPPFGGTGCIGYGGMQNIGTSGQIQTQNYEEKPSFNANMTWVHGNHTFKAGAELYLQQNLTGTFSGVTLAAQGTTPFGTATNNATSEPFVPTFSMNGFTQGFGFADFLLGDYASTTQGPNEFTRQGSQQWGLFIQDSWKLTPKLTVNYGLRWDYATPLVEQYGRLEQLSTSIANANAGGHLGASVYASTCNCNFYGNTYPFAMGPRLGVAYQIDSKTVFRAGWGVTYQFVGNSAGQVLGTNGQYPLAGINPYVNIATPGSIVQPSWPVTDPNIFPVPGTVGAPNSGFGPATDPYVSDPNINRPPRINQWSAGFQREITPNFVMEANYVANRAVWLGGGPLGYMSQTSPQEYAAFGLYPYPGTGPCSSGGGVCKSSTYDNFSDYLLSTQPLQSAGVQARLATVGKAGFTPYAGFPGFAYSLQSAMYPYPQFGAIEPSYSPTGDSKYDSLQIKATKRFSHGFQAGGTYTWGIGYDRPAPQDFFNPQSARWQLQQIPPQTLNFNAIYTVPQAEFIPSRGLKWLAKDWQIGWFASYQSGPYLAPPVSPNLSFLPSEDIRVPGVPLYTQGVNLNSLGSYNPYTTQVLNPAAWQPCPSNAVCAAAAPGPFGPTATVYYKDFRGPRTPSENASIGRNFRFGPDNKFNIFIRAEFVNIFNRTLMPSPGTSNPQNPVQAAYPGGPLVGGFGVINAYLPANTIFNGSGATPACNQCLLGRTGTLIARFSF